MRRLILLALLFFASPGLGSSDLPVPSDEELRAAVAETLMLSRIANGTYEWRTNA